MLVRRDKRDALNFTFGGGGVVTWQFQRSLHIPALPFTVRSYRFLFCFFFCLFLFSFCKRKLLMPPSLGHCETVGTAHLV